MTVQVVHSGATDPRSIVRKALELRKEREQEQRWSPEDTAWAVFDGDEHRLHDPANWNDAFQIAGKKIQLAVSNPCFELWYLLHYQDQQGYLDRDTARCLLKTHLPAYEKNNILWPAPLQERWEEAARRAETLNVRAIKNEETNCPNPSTTVHYLVRSLLALAPST